MQNMQKNRSGGESCSCTTCVYKSESDHPSLRRIIDLGSRIDRLYYGKYIPLRERKLLERLVRTRAVYDDIRAQLVSDSTLSLSTKGDYNPRKKISVRELDDTEKSSGAVFELVNMVDRGAMGSKKLENCCSCCSCSSKIKMHEHRHRQRRMYAGTEEYLARQKRLREAYHRKKGVRFKTKHIRSDPCTCTFNLIKKHSKAIYKKMHSRPHVPLFEPDEEIKQNRSRIGEIARTSYHNFIDSNTRMKEKISQGISKLRESQTRIQEKIEVQTKMSIEKFNQAKGKLASKVRTGAQKIRDINRSEFQFGPENELAFQIKKDSISKFKEELRRKQIMKDWECEPECIEEICIPKECFVRLKQKKIDRKNIHHKGMNYNIRTQERKAGEPFRQSNYKIQAEKLAKSKTIETNKPTLRAQQTRGIKGSHISLEKAPKKIQKFGVTNVADKKGNETSILKIIPVTTIAEKINVENVKANHPAKKTKLENSSLERKSSQRQAVRIGSSFSFNVEFYKDKPGPKVPVIRSQSFTDSKQTPGIDYRNIKPIKEKKTKKRHLRQRGSQIEFKKSLKDKKSGGHALKRCFCTLKLKAKANKSKINRSVNKKIITTEPSGVIFNDVQTNTANKRKKDNLRTKLNLLPYECEPGVCVPGQCDPYRCIKLINIRDSKRRNSSTQARKTRSTSSFTSRSSKPSKANNVQSKVTHRGKASKKGVQKQRIRRGNAISNSHRRAVRIGSTFSFNVEFYKDRPNYQQTTRPPSQLKSLSIKPKKKEHRKVKLRDRGYQGNIGNLHRNTPTQMIKKERNARIGTTLRRCFCTLALQRKDITKNHAMKTLTTGTETSELIPIDTANKGTKTKLKYSRTLKPYECEPYTCVPGACDPYVCIERINMRKKRQKEIGSNSYRHKTPLEPYECEPFTCIPGECDPYVCLERINKRNKHLKEIGLTTNHSKTTSSSSGNTYPEKSLRTAQVQYKPGYKERKVSTKTRKTKRYDEIGNKKYNGSKYSSIAQSKQAVKIGSTFSFDIEFYKNKSPTQEMKQMYPAEKITRANTSKRSINQGIKMKKLNVVQVESQVKGPLKRDKGSVVGPLLKRCFCTLNLQKKWKHQNFKKETSVSRFFQPPRVYTVNRAMIGYTLAHNKNQIHLHNSSNKNFNRNQRTKTLSSLQHKDNINVYKTNNSLKPIKVKSDVHAEKQIFEMPQQCKGTYRIHSQQRVEQLEKFVEGTVNTRDFTKNCSLSSQIHETRLTSLTRYFRRCFYTMNLKIENRGNYKEYENNGSIQRKRHKLLPYECEPGICIPGECDPSECEKMIAKRLMKSSSKKLATRYSSHSISSTANQPFSKSREHKQQTLQRKASRSQVLREKPRVYTKTAKNNKKQTVRLGSTFSFDIEFSKNLSNSHKNVIVPQYSSDTNLAKRVKQSSKSEGTGKRKRNYDSQSQSASIKTVNRGAFTKPSIKRCFCTLKLQKKGRLHKEIENQKQVLPLNELNKEKMVSRGQNTKKVKPLKLRHAIEPYECEPNVCVPGQCDPSKCLERIKKRSYQEEDVGINTILPETKSISSMITDYQRKKKHRSRSVGVKPKHVTITEKNEKSYRELSHPNPSREAVRIGSSFSFNIEFFKDRPSHPHPTNTYIKEESKENKYSGEPSTYATKHTDNYTQNKRNIRHKQSQFENIARHASTLTNSFIKRCFCTAQLYKSKNTNSTLKSERNENSPSFVKRCFCVLKKLKPRITNTVTDVKPKETQDKMINTRKTNKNPKLELYECKPGICVPGECDPYICDKIMRNSRNKNSKATLVDSFKTRTITSSSNIINNGKKSVQTLMKRKNHQILQNRRTKGHRIATSWRPDKNVVRIGSKFSFDIEFFKDHPSKVKHITQKSVKHKSKSIKYTDDKKKLKIGSSKTISPYISQSSQVKKKAVKDRGIGINNLIKRCFCTLKLNEKNNYTHKSRTKEINDDHISKKVGTESVMTVEKNKLLRNALLPYECEPNTCIPYQCDAYECEKRIKLRHKNQVNREFGVSTPGKVSAYSLTDSKKLKTRNQSIMTKKLYQRVKHTPYIDSDTGKDGQSKQSVKIGSTFSFNIEFFKDKHHDRFELQKLHKTDHYHNDRLKIQGRSQGKHKSTNHSIKKNNTHQTQLDKNLMNTSQTQFVNPVMRTQSTMTGYATKKRCFCTLSLKKSEVKPPVAVKTLHASTETDVLKTPIHIDSNLLAYECEPKVCVPYECNPVQCLERIKRRQGMLLPFECEPNFCVPGECNPVQCLERIKKRHKARGTAMPQSQINTFGTAMEESQTRNATILKKGAKNKTAQSKQLYQFNRKKMHEQQKTSNGNNRQAVRIGSNFSFDIEFFKTNNANNVGVTELPKPHNDLPKLRKTKHQLKNKATYGNFEGKNPRSRPSQSFSSKKVSHGSSSMGPFLKRCFCTLKLQKSQVNKIPINNKQTLTEIKPKQRHISSDNKSTATRKLPMETYRLSPFECEPFYCVPGECNPYECAKRIEMREKKNKTQYTITQSHTQSHKGVGVKQHNRNSRRSQASFIDKNSLDPKSIISRPEIVEIPRFTNIFNKQAVRIGSNFSFNIEFYKENLPLTSNNPTQIKNGYDKKVKGDKKTQRKGHKNIHHREQNTNMTRLRNSGSDYDKTKSENKSVEAENMLKRCFCTLKLQNRSPSQIKKKNMQSGIHFPQNFEVRRVAVQHNPKLLSKEIQIRVKSEATKMKKKDVYRKTDLKAHCNFNLCKDGITLLPEDMKTILPYMAEKFNKTVSRTVLPLENKHKKLRESMLKNRGKRLTRKRSVKYLHKKQPQIQAKQISNKSFLGIKCFIDWCAKIFYPKKNDSQKFPLSQNIRNQTLINAPKFPKFDEQSRPNPLISNLKQRKCDQTCPYYLVYQSGDTEQWPPGISVEINKKQIAKSKSLSKKSNTKQQITSKKKTKNGHCMCSMNVLHNKKQNTKSLNMNVEKITKKDKDRSSPLRVRFDDTTMTNNKPQIDKANVKSLPNSKKKLFASGTKSERGIKTSNYCRPCKGKITKEEFHKAAGDQFFYKKIANIKSPCCSVEKIKTKIKDKMRCAMNAEKPLFEMLVDSDSNEILNRNEVIHNVPKLKTKCKPMIEVKVDSNMRKILNKRAVINDVIASNAKFNENSVIRSIMEIGIGQGKLCPCRRGPMISRYTKNSKPTGKPCICGSSVCAKKVESMKTPITLHKWKTCVCGSPVCDRESAKIKALSPYVENKCFCQKEMEKRKAKEKKERAALLKQYGRSEKIRRNERKKKDKMLERKIDKKATDGVLFAESVLDVGKFGITATAGLLRHVAGCARDPKHAIRMLRALEENPKFAAQLLQSSYQDTGLSATLRRVRLRCLAMRGLMKLRRNLESYPLTNYLINIASNDPKRRLLKKKELPKRERERFDFNCSLYMASLRKRPYLSVYDRCPWFYSHFLSLVYAWKQFIDICLFLLAAVVWSPCILCMEICRACMCCFFCTG